MSLLSRLLHSSTSTTTSTSTSSSPPISSKTTSSSPARPTLSSVILHNLKHQHNWTSLTAHADTNSTSVDPSDTDPDTIPIPLLSGLPPTRIYIHPDDQTRYLRELSVLKAELQSLQATLPARTTTVDANTTSALTPESESKSEPNPEQAARIADVQSRINALQKSYETPRREFVAGVWKNASAGLSLAQIAGVFEHIETVRASERRPGKQARHGDENAAEYERDAPVPRFLLAIVDSDSSVVFYVVSDGVVKARQN